MSSETTPSLDSPVPSEPNLTPNAIAVLEDRYLMRGDDGRIADTPAELFRRVANAVAGVEQQWGATAEECGRLEEDFYRLLAGRIFLPNSPTLMNAGRRLGMLSACFVLPLGDSIDEIMETARQEIDNTALLMELIKSTDQVVIDISPSPEHNDIRVLEHNILENLQKKIDIMNARWLDYNRLFTVGKF